VAVSITNKIAVRQNRAVGQETDYFEVWIVGDPDMRATVVALENVLEAHFRLEGSDEERNTMMSRVFRTQDAILEVQQGK